MSQLRMLHLDVGRRVAREERLRCVYIVHVASASETRPSPPSRCPRHSVVPTVKKTRAAWKKKTFTHRRAAAAQLPRKGVGWDWDTVRWIDIGDFPPSYCIFDLKKRYCKLRCCEGRVPPVVYTIQ